MAIRQQGQSTVLDMCVAGRRIRLNFKNMQEAVRAEAKIKLAVMAEDDVAKLLESMRIRQRSGKAYHSTHITLKELMNLTHRRYWTGIAYERGALLNAQAVINYLGESTLVKDVRASDIDQLIDHFKAQRNSNATINRKLAALSKMLHYALDRGHIHTKLKIEKLKESKGRTRFLSAQEEVHLLSQLHSIEESDIADFITCLIDTGCRVSELMRIRKTDIMGNVLTIWTSKNNESRSVPMTRRVREIIEKRSEQSSCPFESISKRRLRTAWNNVKILMGLTDDSQFVPHCLRQKLSVTRITIHNIWHKNNLLYRQLCSLHYVAN